MARSGSGVGSSTRVPIRGFSKFLRDLDAATRSKLESAFSEAELMFDFHSRNTPNRQTRRRISGLVASPVITAENSILGGSVRWDRLDDPKITMYEVQVSTDQVFSNPDSFQVIDTFFGLENISSTRFVRVRAVRFDGATGNWSNTVTLTPTISAPKTFTHTFYQGYTDEEEPGIEVARRYSGEKAPKFYLLFDHTFYASRANATGMTVWGYISSRLKDVRNGDSIPWDRVKFVVNGRTRMEGMFPLWVNSWETTDTRSVNPTTGDPLAFYIQGGYTAGFGPFNELLPVISHGDGPKDPQTATEFYLLEGYSWEDPKNTRRPSHVDLNVDDIVNTVNNDFDNMTVRQDEARVLGLLGQTPTEYLWAHNFGFEVPEGAEITGIEAFVKRRYTTVIDRLLFGWDYGFGGVPPANLHPDDGTRLGQSRYLLDATPGDNLTLDRLEVVDGRIGLRLRAETNSNERFDEIIGTDEPDLEGYMGGDGNNWTVAWSFKINNFITATNPNLAANFLSIRNQAGSSVGPDSSLRNGITFTKSSGRLALVTNRNTGAGMITTTFDDAGSTPFDTSWANFVVTFDGDGRVVRAFKNGAELDQFSFVDNGGNQRDISPGNLEGELLRVLGSSNTATRGVHWGQVAVWSKTLTAGEALEVSKANHESVNLRSNFGSYESAVDLAHWWRFRTGPGNVVDNSIVLTTRGGFNSAFYLHRGKGILRLDGDDKARDESWPILATFYQDGTGAAGSGGYAHDLPAALGYQSYGGQNDLWGIDLDRDLVENFYFGLAVSGVNIEPTYSANAFIDHVKMMVHWTGTQPFNSDEVNCKVMAEAMNHFYVEREVFGGVFNAIEVAE